MNSQALNILKDRKPTSSLGILVQCEENLISNRNFPCSNSCPSPLLSLSTSEKTLPVCYHLILRSKKKQSDFPLAFPSSWTNTARSKTQWELIVRILSKGRGVWQNSVLGPICFRIATNDLEKGMSGEISKFSDNTVVNVIRTRFECTIAERSYEASWQSNKMFCEMLLWKTILVSYIKQWTVTWPLPPRSERDFGVKINSSEKAPSQCSAAVKK